MHDKPDLAKFGVDGVNSEKMTAADRRKFARKQKKQAARDQVQALKDKQQLASQQKQKDPDAEHPVVEPLDPDTLLKVQLFVLDGGRGWAVV